MSGKYSQMCLRGDFARDMGKLVVSQVTDIFRYFCFILWSLLIGDVRDARNVTLP